MSDTRLLSHPLPRVFPARLIHVRFFPTDYTLQHVVIFILRLITYLRLKCFIDTFVDVYCVNIPRPIIEIISTTLQSISVVDCTVNKHREGNDDHFERMIGLIHGIIKLFIWMRESMRFVFATHYTLPNYLSPINGTGKVKNNFSLSQELGCNFEWRRLLSLSLL